ncbi:MAG: ABC transporter substrate-binding protein [Caenispirillum sp.]|nr:ABC transporter substrate-binding protein [Caenispirillum sp.]
MKKMTSLAAASALALSVGATTAQAADSITVASWGGSYQDAQRKAMFEPTAKDLGITVNEATLSSLADVRVQVRSGAVEWDVVDLGATDCAIGAREGLFEPLDYTVIQAEGIDDKMVKDHWIGVIYYSTVPAWNTKTVDKPPQNWADFWNVEAFPGLRSMRNRPQVMLEMALLADGVKPAELYPLDVDRAFKKMEEIKPHIATWWESGAQSVQLAKDGEVDMIAAWDGRLDSAIKDGAAIDFTYNQGLLNADCLAVPKGAPNKELAMQAIAKFVSPEQQAEITKHISYGPVNTKAFDTGRISEEAAQKINTAPQNMDKQVVVDADWWGEHGARMRERWDSMIQR